MPEKATALRDLTNGLAQRGRVSVDVNTDFSGAAVGGTLRIPTRNSGQGLAEAIISLTTSSKAQVFAACTTRQVVTSAW